MLGNIKMFHIYMTLEAVCIILIFHQFYGPDMNTLILVNCYPFNTDLRKSPEAVVLQKQQNNNCLYNPNIRCVTISSTAH